KKRKVAVFVAFVGAGYSGMQHNPGCKTIEGELGSAMNKAGAISDENAGDFSKVQWNRAARTDKGVSAAGNVVSLKMMIAFPDTVERINSHLPEQIRVLGFTRVTNSFDARKHCDRRRYEYILPAFITIDGAAAAAAAEAAGSRQCRFSAEQQARLNEVLGAFEGTHSFHNYTVRVPASDPAAKRYILSFKCAGTMNLEGQQWVRMVVVGQSFMLHQIRKLVGTAVAVMRGVATPDAITLALDPARVVVTPMAPELGLFLDECVFESYNDRWGNDREACVRLAAFQDQVDAFKRERIYPHIASYDAKNGTNAAWL
ncbi:pseudouridine synthase, partial [Coccomyxa subellipsoidea C-169]